MATYSITEDPKWEWVKLITINTNRDIDISSEFFNITVKDQLEYFVADHIKNGSTFELEELFKKDTFPTLEISNNAVQYARQRCFTCTTKENKKVYKTFSVSCLEHELALIKSNAEKQGKTPSRYLVDLALQDKN